MQVQAIGERLTRRIKTLPVLPHAVTRLMGLDAKDDAYFDDVLGILQAEPNYSARILAMANSVIGGSRNPITSLRAGLSRVGSEAAADLLFAISVARVFVPREEWAKRLWRHAIQTAIASRELAARVGDADLVPDEAYTCGLLHDVGRFVMLQEAPELIREVDSSEQDDYPALIASELRMCGLSHAEVGAELCERWNLPEELVEVVRRHHAPPFRAPKGKVAKLISLIQLADIATSHHAAPSDADSDEENDGLYEKVREQMPPFLRLRATELRSLLREVAAEAQSAVSVLGLT